MFIVADLVSLRFELAYAWAYPYIYARVYLDLPMCVV